MIKDKKTVLNVDKIEEEVVLQVNNISKIYQKGEEKFKALDDVSFEVRRGEIFGIVGESGSGKSTIAKQITRLEVPNSGSIIVDDIDITKLKGGALRNIYKKLQMIFQDPVGCFDPRMKVGKSIEELLKNNKYPKDKIKDRVKELFELVGLREEHIDKYPNELSGGQCQRAAIARALSTEPEILICDEITSALDVSIQGQIINLLKNLKEENQMTYLFICHDLALVELLCDKVIVVHKGSIVESGYSKDVINNPMHPYTKLLLNSIFPIGNREWSIPDIPMEENSFKKQGCKFYDRCSLRKESCLASKPELKKFENGHSAACHLL